MIPMLPSQPQRAEDMEETRVTDKFGEVRPRHIPGIVVLPRGCWVSNSRVTVEWGPVGLILDRELSLHSPAQPSPPQLR